MAVILSGTTNDITIGGVSVATDTEVASAITDAVTTAGIALKTIASGTATFTATTNNINLTGIGVGVEIGDVIQISGAIDAKNNSEFTIEVITDANNIIVNQAHANKGTSKNVATRVSDTNVTVKLLAKWYNAPKGLGQDWVTLTSSRVASTTYPNNTKRTIDVSVTLNTVDGTQARMFLDINGVRTSANSGYLVSGSSYGISIYGSIASGDNYMLENIDGKTLTWHELR